MTSRTDQEISRELHALLQEQIRSLLRLAEHAPYGYIAYCITNAAAFLHSADTAWHEEERLTGTPLYR